MKTYESTTDIAKDALQTVYAAIAITSILLNETKNRMQIKQIEEAQIELKRASKRIELTIRD